MVSNQIFSPKYCQIALFFSENYSLKFLGAASDFMEKFDGIFSKEPVINTFPSHMDIPPEVPRICLTEDKVGQLLISKVRADLYLMFDEKRDLLSIPNVVELFSTCFSVKDVAHFGLACVYDLSEGVSISDVIHRYFCDGKVSNPVDIQLGWTKKVPMDVSGIVSMRQSVRFYLSDNGERSLTIEHDTRSCEMCHFVCVEDIGKLSTVVLRYLGNDLYETLEWN